ncbi:MAG: prepilin peptidase [Deltaproteobacteria bacterium]|nr:prepilin peptidase [Deltaproteobacteria bacterium]
MDADTMAWLATPPRELPTYAAVFVLGTAFLFGSLWGSFLNVVIARVPRHMSVVTPRSRCPKCEKQIGAIDNIPILSWLILRAKCRNCGTSISARYPFVELLGGLSCAAAVARFGVTLPAIELTVFILVLIAISFIDLDTFTVPYSLVVALAGSGLGFGLIRWLIGAEAPGGLSSDAMIDRVIGGVGSGIMLGAVVVVSTAVLRRVKTADGTPRVGPDEWAMGSGDPMIIAGIGCHLGWQLMPLTLFLASVVGSVIGIGLKASGKLKNRGPISEEDPWVPPDDAIPFGPFLALGGLLAAFFGDAIHERMLPLLGFGPDGIF